MDARLGNHRTRGRPETTAQAGIAGTWGKIRATTRVAPTLGGLEEWLGYPEARIGRARDCSGETGQASLDIMRNFIDDAIGLYQTMTGETWD